LVPAFFYTGEKLKTRKRSDFGGFSSPKARGKKKRKNSHIHIFGSHCVAKDIEG